MDTITSEERNRLTVVSMQLMNIGKRYWKSSVRDIPDDYKCKEVILRYHDHIVEMMREGVGLILFGPKGHGKTHIATALLKKARAHNARCLFLPVNRLQEVVIERPALEFDDEEEPIFFRARRADLLVLDDLGEEYAKEFSTRMLENLCRYRSNRHRATIFTTNLNPEEKNELAKHYGSWIDSLLKDMASKLRVMGHDFREDNAAARRRLLEGR